MWDKVLDIDLKSIFFGMREVLPHMIKRKQGSIINLASIWGLAGVPNAHAYQAAKGAILNVSKNVACTHGQDGIRCNSLHPGYIVTPMNKDQGPVIEAALINGTLLKRPGQPIEIAYAALFLASDEASYVTGTSLVVDGGYLAP
jgi:cyclopentanol dehydrogenase